MDLHPAVGLAAVVILVLANGFFVATEFAIVAVRRSRLEELAGEGGARARAAREVVTHLDAYIAATQFGITLASLALGWIGEPALAHLLEPPLALIAGTHAPAAAHGTAIAVSFALITALHIVIGELAPKGLALQKPEATTLWVARPIQLFYAVFKWPVSALNAVGNGALRLLGLQPASGHEMVHSVEELRLLVTGMQQAGVVDPAEARIAKRAFTFSDVTVGGLMTPRTEMAAASIGETADELIAHLERSGRRRLPIFEGSIDSIIGVLDGLRLLRERPADPEAVRALLEPPLMVPDTTSAADLLEQMRQSQRSVAIVLDEYGGTAGVVTITNLFEALVGRFAPPASGDASGPGQVFDGLMRAGDFADAAGLTLDETAVGAVETLGGLVAAVAGRFPRVGEEISIGGRRLRIEARDGMRIARVRLLP